MDQVNEANYAIAMFAKTPEGERYFAVHPWEDKQVRADLRTKILGMPFNAAVETLRKLEVKSTAPIAAQPKENPLMAAMKRLIADGKLAKMGGSEFTVRAAE